MKKLEKKLIKKLKNVKESARQKRLRENGNKKVN